MVEMLWEPVTPEELDAVERRGRERARFRAAVFALRLGTADWGDRTLHIGHAGAWVAVDVDGEHGLLVTGTREALSFPVVVRGLSAPIEALAEPRELLLRVAAEVAEFATEERFAVWLAARDVLRHGVRALPKLPNQTRARDVATQVKAHELALNAFLVQGDVTGLRAMRKQLQHASVPGWGPRLRTLASALHAVT